MRALEYPRYADVVFGKEMLQVSWIQAARDTDWLSFREERERVRESLTREFSHFRIVPGR